MLLNKTTSLLLTVLLYIQILKIKPAILDRIQETCQETRPRYGQGLSLRASDSCLLPPLPQH